MYVPLESLDLIKFENKFVIKNLIWFDLKWKILICPGLPCALFKEYSFPALGTCAPEDLNIWRGGAGVIFKR